MAHRSASARTGNQWFPGWPQALGWPFWQCYFIPASGFRVCALYSQLGGRWFSAATGTLCWIWVSEFQEQGWNRDQAASRTARASPASLGWNASSVRQRWARLVTLCCTSVLGSSGCSWHWCLGHFHCTVQGPEECGSQDRTSCFMVCWHTHACVQMWDTSQAPINEIPTEDY